MKITTRQGNGDQSETRNQKIMSNIDDKALEQIGEDAMIAFYQAEGNESVTEMDGRVTGYKAVAAYTRKHLFTEMDEELRWILGRPSFTLQGIFSALRLEGVEIKRKCEDEQAAAIFWMLKLYMEHGPEKWRDVGNAWIRAVRDKRLPHSITFFPNGQTAVCNKNGEQMGEFQGSHQDSIKRLKDAGIDWQDIPDKMGTPGNESE